MAVALKGSAAQASYGAAPTAPNPGTASGDLAVVLMYSDTALQTQSGWTLAGSISTYYNLAIYWKIAGASEPATWTFTSLTGSTNILGSLIFTGHDSSTPLGTPAMSSGASTATQVAGSVTPARANSMLVAAFAAANATATHTAPTGMTKAWDQAEGIEIDMAAFTQALSTTAATGSLTSTCSAASNYDSAAFIVNAAASVSYSGTGATSGAGTASGSGGPQPAASGMTTGSSSLGAAGFPADTASVGIGGSGALATATTIALTGSAAASGGSALTATGGPAWATSATSSGGGLLAGSGGLPVFVGPSTLDWLPFSLYPPTRLSYATPYGQTVWRDALGAWHAQSAPTLDQLAGADRIYAGGRVYRLSGSQAAELVAAGYGTYVTLLSDSTRPL